MSLAGDPQMTRPFLQNPWIYACVTKRANALASMPLRFRDAAGKTVESSKLQKLFERPNPLMSQREFWVAHSTNMDLVGECFWILLKRSAGERNGSSRMVPISKGELPDEIWTVRGDIVQPVLDDVTKLPRAWTIGADEYPAHAVVQFAFYDPYNLLRGVGPLQAVLRTAFKDFQADRYDEALLRNGGSPGGVLSLQGTLNTEQRKALQKAWHDAVESPEQHRKTAVLELGTTFTPIGFSPVDMEHKDLRMWDRDIYMAVFGVTRALLALTEGLNYASATEAKKIFWHDTVKPNAEITSDKVTVKFIRQLAGVESQWTAFFDMSNVEELQATLSSKVDLLMKLIQQCGFSKNEAARICQIDLGVIKDGDRHFVPASMQPLPEEKAKYDAQVAAAKPQPAAVARSVRDDREAFVPINGHIDIGPVGGINRIAALEQADARELYWRRMEDSLLPLDRALAKKIEPVYRNFVLAARARLRDLASKAAVPTHEKIILTQEEVDELVQLNTRKWVEQLDAKLELIGDAWDLGAQTIAQEVRSNVALMTRTDPLALQFLQGKRIAIAEGTMSTLAEQLRLTIMRTLAETPSEMAVAEAIADKLRELEDQMKDILETIESRAFRIARTENTSIYNGSRMENMSLAGVASHMWLSARDAHVRPDHKTLDGMVARVGFVFAFNLRYPGDPQAGAEQLVHCFVPDTQVSGRFSAGSKAFYSGPVRRIVTARGHTLSVTPNHPILTSDGWKPAGSIKKGDHLFADSNDVGSVALRNVDNENGPAAIKDVFETLLADGRLRSVVASVLDFHGDAKNFRGKVSVVDSYRPLRLDGPAQANRVEDEFLVFPYRALSVGREQNPCGGGDWRSALRTPRPRTLTNNGGAILLERAPLQELRIGPASNWDARISEHAKQELSADTVGIRQILEAGSGLVSPDEVVGVFEVDFCGHVYDLQSSGGWLLANGIVSGNCRCTTVPVQEDSQ